MQDPHVTRNLIVSDATTGQVVEVISSPLKDKTDTTILSIIEKALGGLNVFESLPVLDLGDSRGNTGYIDFLLPSDVSCPVMRGTDTHGRPFISFKLSYTKKNGEVIECVETIFRRYTTGSVWVSGGCRGGGRFFCLSAMKDEDIDFLKRVFNGEDAGNRRYTWLRPEERETRIEEAKAKGRNIEISGENMTYEVGQLRISHEEER
jgi:hypothetical protein